jgi:hypothetical protein
MVRSSNSRTNRAERFEFEDDRRRSTDHMTVESGLLGRMKFRTLCPIKATLVFLTFATSQDREILRQPRCPVLAQN